MTLDAEKMANSVRAGDMVVLTAEAVDEQRPHAARAVDPLDDLLLVVTFTADGPGELLQVDWDQLQQYQPREHVTTPSQFAAQLDTGAEEEEEEEVEA